MPTSPLAFPERRKGPLDRALSVFTEVKTGEGVSALLLALNVFLLLASYYILKTVREPLILTQGGAEVKSYAAAGQALLLLLVVPAYGILAARVNRIRLITWVTLFFISNLLIFQALGAAGVHVGVAFFLWVGIFNVFVVAQFWAFANDIYTQDQGKRLFPIVGVGSSLGAWVGSESAKRLFGMFDQNVAPYSMMLVAGGGLAVCILISQMVNRREKTVSRPEEASNAEKPLGKEGGFKLVFSQRYLLLIAVLILILNLVNTTGEFILGKVVTLEIARQTTETSQQEVMIGRFYGDFFGWVNLLGLLFQLFLVSRIFKWVGVRGALFILPCVALGSYSLLAALPVLGVIRIAKILENSTDYSINNTTRHALFLPTSREAKYKAKAAIDTFFWRIGDMLQAAVVFIGTQLAFQVRHFGMINVVFVLIWLAVAVAIFRKHKELTAEEELPQAA